MIYNALLVPNEFPPTLQDVKRALLSFDKVLLVSPDDRELIPPTSWMTSISPWGFMFPIVYGNGPVRPLGKWARYDETFDDLSGELRPAREQGFVDVISTYDRAATDSVPSVTFGGINLGGYPVNPRLVVQFFAAAGQQQDILKCVLDKDLLENLSTLDVAEALATTGVADVHFKLPLIDVPLTDERFREPLTKLARGRIATAIKMIGYCEAKDVIPLFSSAGQCAFGAKLQTNTSALLTAMGHQTSDPFWLQLNNVLQAINEEYVDEEALSRLSVDDVIRLRTSAWGKQAAARERLFVSIQRIAEDVSEIREPAAKEKAIADAVGDYRKAADDLERERAGLVYRAIFKTAAALPSVPLSSVLAQLGSPFTAVMTLGAGIAWGLNKLSELGPDLIKWRDHRREHAKSPGSGIASFYSKMRPIIR